MGNAENLIIEHLRALRSGLERIEHELTEVKLRLTSIEERVSLLEKGVANIHGDISLLHSRLDRMDARMDRIERRLELREAVWAVKTIQRVACNQNPRKFPLRILHLPCWSESPHPEGQRFLA